MEQSQAYSRHNHFHIIKPNRRPQTAVKKTNNIFEGCDQKLLDDEKPIYDTRIVGSMEAYLKQQRRREVKQAKNYKNSKQNMFISQKKVPKPGVVESAHTGQTRQQKLKQIKQNQIDQHQHPKRSTFVDFQQEAFKSHQAFRPKTSASTIKSNKMYECGTNKDFYSCSSLVIRPASSKVTQNSLQWANSQIQNYNNKSAMLSQITYTQPLYKRYGDRYFEFCLRDRHKQDRPLPPYIYQIKNQNQKLNKFTKTLQKFRPDIALKSRLVVQGRLLTEELVKQ